MVRNSCWNNKVRDEIGTYVNSSFRTFWNSNYCQIIEVHSFINEFELESEELSFELMKTWFLNETGKLNFQKRTKFVSEEKKGILIITITLPKVGKELVFETQIMVSVDPKKITLRIDPGTGINASFSYYRYKSVLNIIRDLVSLDLSGLNEEISGIVAKSYVTEKNAEIAINTIDNLCSTFLETKGINYRLYHYALTSVLDFNDPQTKNYVSKKIMHKEFNENPKELMDFIRNVAVVKKG